MVAMGRRLAAAAVLLAACTDPEVSTDPTAHETPPAPPPPLQTILRSTFLGGSGLDQIDDVLVAPDGSIYVVGGTASPDFPTTDGSTLDTAAAAGCSACPFDAFVARFGPDGTPDWVRLLGAPGYDRLTSVQLVGDTLFVGGSTGLRPNLDGWHGGVDPAGERGEQDGLVCALTASSGAVQTCRYLGGAGPDGVADVALTGNGSTLIAVMIAPAGDDLHLDPAYQAAFAVGGGSNPHGGADVAMFALRNDQAMPLALGWATYVGGSGDERGTPDVITDDGATGGARVLVLTETTSRDAPTPLSFAATPPSDDDNAYLAVYLSDGRTQLHGGYLGGSGVDRVSPSSIAIIAGGLAVVGLSTTSTDAPTTPGGFQAVHGGNGGPGCGDGDVWLGAIIFGSTSSTLLASTYLGGSGGERLDGVARIAVGLYDVGVLVTGHTYSTNLRTQTAAQPSFAGAPCASSPGSADAFAAVFAPQFTLEGATYLGGAAFDRAASAAVGFDRRIVVVGETASTNFPALGPWDLTANGGTDGFITEYGPMPWIPPGDGGTGGDGGCFTPSCDGGFDVGPDGGEPYTESGAFCVCGAGGSPAASVGPSLLVLAMVLFRRRRRR